MGGFVGAAEVWESCSSSGAARFGVERVELAPGRAVDTATELGDLLTLRWFAGNWELRRMSKPPFAGSVRC